MREQKWNLGRFIGRSSALLLLFALLFLPSAWAEEGENLPKIIIGSDEYQPYSYYNVDGSPQGVDVEMAREAFRRMGYAPVFRMWRGRIRTKRWQTARWTACGAGS